MPRSAAHSKKGSVHQPKILNKPMSERGFNFRHGKYKGGNAATETKSMVGEDSRKQSTELMMQPKLSKKFQTPSHSSKGNHAASALYLRKKNGTEMRNQVE